MLTRLAPTPSGYIHTGNIFNFLLSWLWAKSNNGKVLLRIDDGDTQRKRKEYVEDIFNVLDWLQLDWDIGPRGPDDFEKNWSQTVRSDLYNDILTELLDKELVFACSCNRKQECVCETKKLSLSTEGTAWKIKVPANSGVHIKDRLTGNVSTRIDRPFVIKRKDNIAAYQVCSLADDRYFKTTHICRGDDLKESTAMQLYIDKQLSSPYFNTCRFWHHPLVTDESGNKFSKSTGIMNESIINQITKEALLTSFAKWMRLDVSGKISIKDMIGMKAFIIPS